MSETKTIKVFLYFPPEATGEPIAYKLVKDYDLTFNILNAEVTLGKHGRLTLELTGAPENIEKGLAYVAAQGVQTKVFSKNIIWSEQKCVACGACTGVCPAGALTISECSNWALAFDSEKCLVCEACIKACPVRAIDVDVFL